MVRKYFRPYRKSSRKFLSFFNGGLMICTGNVAFLAEIPKTTLAGRSPRFLKTISYSHQNYRFHLPILDNQLAWISRITNRNAKIKSKEIFMAIYFLKKG
jgi:hypothetical protein